MPRWSNEIPKDARGPALPIRRTPAQRPLIAIVTSHDLLGCYTHFFKGHTVPCEPPNCEACLAGLPYRWHAYLSAWEKPTNLHFLYETTALGAEPLVQYRDAHAGLRGCCFHAHRWNGRPNGRILIQTKQAEIATIHLPDPPDLKVILSILWDLKSTEVQSDHRNPETKTPVAQVYRNPDDSPAA